MIFFVHTVFKSYIYLYFPAETYHDQPTSMHHIVDPLRRMDSSLIEAYPTPGLITFLLLGRATQDLHLFTIRLLTLAERRGYCDQFHLSFVLLSVYCFALITQKLLHQSSSNSVDRYFIGYRQVSPNLV